MWPGPYGEWGSRKHLLSSLDASLRRMRIAYVDIFYSHRPDPHTPLEETLGALATAVTSGRALYVGLSKYPLEMLKEAVTLLDGMGVRTLVYQPPYSILNRWPETSGILEWLEAEGIGSVSFSPLAQGMLTPKYAGGIPADSRAGRPEGFLRPDQVVEQQQRTAALAELAAERGQLLHHMAIQWVIHQRGVTSTIIGTRNVAQLDDNLRALTGPAFTAEELARIDALAPGVRRAEAEG
jgi:L-glyceraldehyde 3-phosphate reductase